MYRNLLLAMPLIVNRIRHSTAMQLVRQDKSRENLRRLQPALEVGDNTNLSWALRFSQFGIRPKTEGFMKNLPKRDDI